MKKFYKFMENDELQSRILAVMAFVDWFTCVFFPLWQVKLILAFFSMIYGFFVLAFYYKSSKSQLKN